MHSTTFLAEVQGGRILTGHPLTDFEAKQVYVTLIDRDVQSGTVSVEPESPGFSGCYRAAPEKRRSSKMPAAFEDSLREVTDVRITWWTGIDSRCAFTHPTWRIEWRRACDSDAIVRGSDA